MANYCVQVFDGPYGGDKAFPTLDAAKAHCDGVGPSICCSSCRIGHEDFVS